MIASYLNKICKYKVISMQSTFKLKSRIKKGAEYSHDVTVGFSFQDLQLLCILLVALPLLYHASVLRSNILKLSFQNKSR